MKCSLKAFLKKRFLKKRFFGLRLSGRSRGLRAQGEHDEKRLSSTPRTTLAEGKAVDAMREMEAGGRPVSFLPVIDEEKKLAGLLTLHGLVNAGL